MYVTEFFYMILQNFWDVL